MSPYGDVAIINKIKNVKNVKVYVYDKEHNAQLKEWGKILSTTNCEILDSGEFVI